MTNFKLPRVFHHFLAFATVSAICATPASAEVPTATHQDIGTIQSYVNDFLLEEMKAMEGAASVKVRPIDKRTKLKPCKSMSASLGFSKALGSPTVAVKCVAPSIWTINVQAKTELIGNYLVARNHIQRGQPIHETDLSVKTGELSLLPASVAKKPSDIVGKVLNYAVAPGTAIRMDAVKRVFNIQAGQPVVIRTSGNGFSISTEGMATNSAYPGDEARAKTVSGQNISGITRTPGIIDAVF